jgi:ABC-type transporter Mla subunit MlaD
VVGKKADAFDDADDLEADIAELEGLLESIVEAHDQVSDLTATIPELRGTLEDAHEDADD